MNGPPLLVVPQKRYRATVIASWMARSGYTQAVCFTCGNAAYALRDAGVDVLEVGPRGELVPTDWWTPSRVRRVWPDRFDATPGHLPLHLMIDTANAIRQQEPRPEFGAYSVPTGSGETILCVKLAWPELSLLPVFDLPGLEAETRYDPDAPLLASIAGVVA